MSMRQIRERDENGVLTRAGYEWWEQSEAMLSFSLIVLMLGGFALLGSLFIWAFGHPLGLPAVTISAIAMLLGWRGLGRAHRLNKRALIFEADGSITTPNGVPDDSSKRKLMFGHADIASIEGRKYGSYFFISKRSPMGARPTSWDTRWLVKKPHDRSLYS